MSLRHRTELTLQIARREIQARYRGSTAGLAWIVLTPIFTLAIYTFVFAVVFRARWPALDSATESSAAEFAVIVFLGLILHGFMADCLTRAPTQITGNLNYVKKVVFPLEVLAVAQLIAALALLLPTFGVLLLFQLWVFGMPPITVLLSPLAVLPLSLMVLGSIWIISALAVFFRDIGQIIGLIVTALLFLAPILYPMDIIPQQLRQLMYVNPLTFPIEALRDLALWGRLPSFESFVIYSACSVVVCLLGWAFFQWSRDGFADVL